MRLESVRRGVFSKISRAYRIMLTEAECLIVGVPPIVQLADSRLWWVKGVTKRDAQARVLLEWHVRWDHAIHGPWTHRLIPRIGYWVDRTHGELSYNSSNF